MANWPGHVPIVALSQRHDADAVPAGRCLGSRCTRKEAVVQVRELDTTPGIALPDKQQRLVLVDRWNPGGRPHGSRNRSILNEEFIAALLRHFRREGERAITRMAAAQPAAYCKILTLLVPREHRSGCRNSSRHRRSLRRSRPAHHINGVGGRLIGDSYAPRKESARHRFQPCRS